MRPTRRTNMINSRARLNRATLASRWRVKMDSEKRLLTCPEGHSYWAVHFESEDAGIGLIQEFVCPVCGSKSRSTMTPLRDVMDYLCRKE